MSTIQISRLLPEQCEELRAVFKRSSFKPHRALGREAQASVIEYWWQAFVESVRGAGRGAFVAHDGTEALGVVVCSRRSWESEVLDAPVGGLEYFIVDPARPKGSEAAIELLSSVKDWALSAGFACVMCNVYCDDVLSTHALERSGFLMMDTVLDYVYHAKADPLQDIRCPRLAEGAIIRPACGNDADRLASLARAAFRSHFGRFHADERISTSTALNVYAEWMRSSLNGYADQVLVAEIDGQLAGCSVWRNSSTSEARAGLRVGHYSIGLVHPDYRGRGLFSALTYRGMQLYEGAVDFLEGPTHVNNLPVQRAYANLRWRPNGGRHSFHLWFK